MNRSPWLQEQMLMLLTEDTLARLSAMFADDHARGRISDSAYLHFVETKARAEKRKAAKESNR